MRYLKHIVEVAPILIALILISYFSKEGGVVGLSIIVAFALVFPNPVSIKALKWKNKTIHAINKVLVYILLGISYFCLLWPIALVKKIFNKKEQRIGSTFVNRSYTFTQRDLDNLW